MKKLLEALSKEFDIVLCDAPPLLPVTDAAVLSRVTSGAIMAVAVGKTTTHQLEGALDALETVGAKVAGVVLTMVPTKGADAYGYGYGYGYGGYGYKTPAPKDGAAKDKTPEPKRRATAKASVAAADADSDAFDDLLKPS